MRRTTIQQGNNTLRYTRHCVRHLKLILDLTREHFSFFLSCNLATSFSTVEFDWRVYSFVAIFCVNTTDCLLVFPRKLLFFELAFLIGYIKCLI